MIKTKRANVSLPKYRTSPHTDQLLKENERLIDEYKKKKKRLRI
ncbi:type II toxin-antitoxin system SpoIISB family antitoxin [Bacillus aquiflavi]|uniref:Type II toxin-antitoxin system SpoIISB family antitoxin n=1 Tax=Bacillus aquiflavi TaxID=2672567 RepID=A0A6B3VWS9_9BACI|nr:type II toxin-antitoxin system SpoIISB family antitoxin [Bacillus aquiflavi]MBA4538342.1 type II toxin-antitoxin system SpoIISB family antitoxin [Bacillus aquiflavi]NEY82690.1 hypothetical protein [Bacillus aquiflavi]